MMRMKMNYNSWFYKTHAYLQNVDKNGLVDYNDTKTINLGDRYNKLVELESELFSEQPFGVISNKRGFNKLIDLMEKSNYTFDDINDSLVDTYRMSLTNAMSRMLVNTHAVMFKCKDTDKRYVSSDRLSRYYIVEAPFDQLHFGDRDEFIRQQLKEMHTEANGHYVSLIDFSMSPFTDLLGFTLMCCVNGKICNDCKVAIDDKGFKFKINWPYDYKECYFVIYKLDNSKVYVTNISYDDYMQNTGSIPVNCPDAIGQNCIVNMYDMNYARSYPSVPNFGILNKSSLKLMNVQQYTLDYFERLKTKNITVVIYAIKYFNEVPNLYPAVNYYDIIDARKVYDEFGDNVVDKNDKQIYSSATRDINELEICTPPIVLDRSASTSFSTIVNCLGLSDLMMYNNDAFHSIGNRLSSGNISTYDLNVLKDRMRDIEINMKKCYNTYIEGGLLTSLIDSERFEKFEVLMTNISNFITKTNTQNLPQYTDYNIFPELYGNGFATFVNYITKPFMNNALKPFTTIMKSSANYFVSENATKFNRPVSEQCFITMKYDRIDNCWVFDIPNIEHFKGIGNTFYVNDDLKGHEIFKFFVLYTDTEAPEETSISPLTFDQVFDFDLFYDEIEKHVGYIKYWNAENKLARLCKTIYNEYSQEQAVQVLSKILKRKLDGDDIIDQYPTEMNYEPSNESSLNWDNYDEYSDEAPFAVNFLFYTLSLMNGNEDKLQSYLYRSIIKRNHHNRYADIDVASILDRSFMIPVNYSKLSISPIGIDTNKSAIPITPGISGFYGIPFLVDNNASIFTQSPYRYTFNVYEDNKQYPLVINNDIESNNYLEYGNIKNFNASEVCYRYDINMARLLTRYLIVVYDMISYLQTYYKIPINTVEDIVSYAESINECIKSISSYFYKHRNDFIHPDTVSLVSSVLNDNFYIKTFDLGNRIASIRQISYNGRTTNVESVANEFLKTLKSVYINTGFDDAVEKRVRNLYLHFKKINDCQSIYDFLKWVENIDVEMMQNLDGMRSENENGVYVGTNVFSNFANAFENYVAPSSSGGRNTIAKINNLKTVIDGLYSSNYVQYIQPIITYCEDIIENWIFDFFILDEIDYNKTNTYSEEPYMITVNVTSDPRFHPNVGNIIDTNATLIFKPIVEEVNNRWVISEITKICEYAFFVGTDYQVTMNVLNKSGGTIQTVNGTMKFFKIGSSADDMISFNQYPNVKNSCIDIQNIHEEFEIDNRDHIVNKKFGKMNYELLVGNSYQQLDHTSELILERKTMLPGSIDRIYLPGYMLNKLSTHDFGQHTSYEVYFKPSQVLHLQITDDEMTSVGGKYFVGQTLYLVTNDETTIFPVIVTAVDMSESSGFVETKIDSIRAKWFKLDDITQIKQYMSQPIQCTVIDDNISNFLDEFSNPNNVVYQIPEFPQSLDPSDEDNPNAYSMPGDPIYVTSNAPYVYTRLNWIFNQDIPNRYMDTHPQDHHMIYIGSTDSLDSNADIKIKLLNHSFEPFTDPENYPILRDEPDDHFVWDEEKKVFDEIYRDTAGKYAAAERAIATAWRSWSESHDHSKWAWERFQIHLQDLESTKNRVGDKMARVRSYMTQLEYPTTWYNVRTYESAMVYIKNGKAPHNISRITNIRNIPYTDKLEVYIYDWENHHWLDPSTYSVSVEVLDSVQIGEFENYKTRNVMNSISITPESGFPTSRKILIYLAYDKSDVFEDITINPKTCDVRFKPLLTLDSTVTDYDPYSKINIRKHFDGHEKYIFNEYSEIDNFSQNGYLFKRPHDSGKYVKTPNIRFIDMVAINGDNELTYDDFDIYLRIPFKDTTTSEQYLHPTYTTTIIQPIDGFVPGESIKLICVSNNDISHYDGNVSSIIFEAYVDIDNDDQVLTITKSSLPEYISGAFTCTVLQDIMYPHSGGLIVVNVSSTGVDVVDGNWIKLVNGRNDVYRILPDEFVLVPKESISGDIVFDFKTEYQKSIDDDITLRDIDNINNPYEFYYDKDAEIKYPIGNVRKNNNNERFVIDKSINPNIEVGKNTYISICRYACRKIPKDGIIDMTGYLPTPLSRDHYEFWVNGRYIRDELTILSPTSIQLTNLKSLRNFECVELVDDYSDSELMQKGPVYIDLEGNVYSSHKLAVSSGKNIYTEDIQYTFNGNNQHGLINSTRSIISNPNNKDIEKDILDTISIVSDTPTYYEELINIPSIRILDLD